MSWIRIVSGLIVVVALGLPWHAALAADHAPAASHGETAAEGHGGGHGEANSNPLEWKADLALWTGVVFVALMLILWKFAWKPIALGLDRREKSISDHIAQAQRQNDEARQLLASYQQKLSTAQDEVRAIMDRARREAEQAGRELLDKARAEVKQEHQKALREIDTATAHAIKELAERSADLAVQLAGKIVHRSLKPADHAQLIQEAVQGFSKVKAGSA